VVCGVVDTTPENNTVAIEALNPGRSIGNDDEVAQNTDIGSRVGSPTNPRATTKSMFRDAEFKEG